MPDRILVKTARRLESSPWPVVGVFITSVFVTILFWTILPASHLINENSDYAAFYEPVGRNILNGSGFVSRDGRPAIRVAPGYPILLAGTFKIAQLLKIREQTMHSIFTLLSMGLASVLIFMLAQSVWGLFPALVSSVVWMTYPLALWFTKQTNSEIPFLPVFYGGFYVFWYALSRKSHWSIYFLSGLIIGFAMLIRPIAIWAVLVMALILWLVVSEKKPSFKLFLILIMLLGNLVAIFPWEMWLYTRTGKVVPLRKGSLKDSLTFAVNPKGYRRGVKVPQDVEALMRSVMGRTHELRSPKGILSIMVEQLRTRPLAVVKLFAIKAVRSWYGTDSNRFENQILMLQIPYLVFILWGSRAAWKQGGVAKELAISVWLMTLYFWSMTMVAFSIVRYMVPAIGLLFVLIPGAFAKTGKLTCADSGIAAQ